MAHVEKYTRADATGIFIHYERTPGHELSNKDIDVSRSHLNYNLADHDQPLPQGRFLSDRLKAVKTNGRKNQNVMADWIITQPADVKEGDSRKFFREAYDFLAGMYGRENIISAHVHMDEIGKTPHMHFCFMPVEILDDGTEKLNAKTVINRQKLNSFHRQLQKEMDTRMGYHVSIQTGETQKQGGNKTVRQLKAESEAVKQLPEGKQALLGKNKSYTQEEDRILHEKAELGVAYETEIAVRQDLKRLQEQKTYALNKKDTDLNLREKELLKKEQDLCIREEQLNHKHITLEREYARKMGEVGVAPELLQKLEKENRSLKEVLYAIFEYFGSRIINSIPGISDRIQIDGPVSEEPSAAFMDMVENRFIKPLREALGNAEQIIGNIREAVLDMLKGLHVLN